MISSDSVGLLALLYSSEIINKFISLLKVVIRLH